MNSLEAVRWGGPATLLAVALWRAGGCARVGPLVLLVGNAAGFYAAYSLAFFTI
jgi:hypothetical protein